MASEAFDLRLAVPFVVLAEELHFGRAAERLGTKQPALSQQLARLERQLGVQLVERGGGQVALTAAGVRFLVEVREMLARVGRAQAALRSGELRVHLGATVNAAIRDVVASFVGAHPEIVVRTVEDAPSAAPRAVRAGEADVGVGMPSDAGADLSYIRVTSGAYGVATSIDHPIAVRGRATWTDLQGAAIFVAPPGISDAGNRMLRTTLYEMDVRVRETLTPKVPRVSYLGHQLATGVALLVTPSWPLDPRPPDVAWTVLEPQRRVELGMLWSDRAANESVRWFVAWVRARSGATAEAGGDESPPGPGRHPAS